jgi:hypothetical protein
MAFAGVCDPKTLEFKSMRFEYRNLACECPPMVNELRFLCLLRPGGEFRDDTAKATVPSRFPTTLLEAGAMDVCVRMSIAIHRCCRELHIKDMAVQNARKFAARHS